MLLMHLERILLILLLYVPTAAYAQKNASEEQIKAAFIYNFAKFVTWPDEMKTDSSEFFRICILGRKSLKEEVERAVNGKTIRGSRIKVTDDKSEPDGLSPHIVYIPTAVSISSEEMSVLHAKNTLTVGESKQFRKAGGIICFYLNDKRIRFEINPNTAEAANLSVSSKLMRVARVTAGD